MAYLFTLIIFLPAILMGILLFIVMFFGSVMLVIKIVDLALGFTSEEELPKQEKREDSNTYANKPANNK